MVSHDTQQLKQCLGKVGGFRQLAAKRDVFGLHSAVADVPYPRTDIQQVVSTVCKYWYVPFLQYTYCIQNREKKNVRFQPTSRNRYRQPGLR